jgi:hypothetical protein
VARRTVVLIERKNHKLTLFVGKLDRDKPRLGHQFTLTSCTGDHRNRSVSVRLAVIVVRKLSQ